MSEKKIYTLSTIMTGIKQYLDERIKSKRFWLKAEIGTITIDQKGHYYLTLDETREQLSIARCDARLWRVQAEYLEKQLGKNNLETILKKGNQIVCLVELEFNQLYGLAVIIKEVDLEFSLGVLELRRQQTLERLKQENLLTPNKRHSLPIVIQKIALIGSPDTAGFVDILKQLSENAFNYCFQITPFPCQVQGERAEKQIAERLKQTHIGDFDVVALIRGGGSKLDLDVFNSYVIAREIGLHPKPVFTGIGHETDTSVADIVAHTAHKTPTALGSSLVERMHTFDIRVQSTFNYVIEYQKQKLHHSKNQLLLHIQTLTSHSISITRTRRGDLHTLLNRIITQSRQQIQYEQNKTQLAQQWLKNYPASYLIGSRQTLTHTLELIDMYTKAKIKLALDTHKATLALILAHSQQQCEKQTHYLEHVESLLQVYNPYVILKKGYAIPRFQGSILADQILKNGDELDLELHDRILVVSFIKNKESWSLSKWINSVMNKHPKS